MPPVVVGVAVVVSVAVVVGGVVVGRVLHASVSQHSTLQDLICANFAAFALASVQTYC